MTERGVRPRGRPPGAKNKATRLRERELQKASQKFAAVAASVPGAFAGDALTLLTSVYKDPNIPLDIRIDAAKTAIRYERPPLAPVAPTVNPEDEAAKAQRLHAMIEEMKRTVGSG